MDVIDLCDSDDSDNDGYPLHQLRSGRDENDAISLSSTEDDSAVVVVGIGPSEDGGTMVDRSIDIVSQANAIENQLVPVANLLPMFGAADARNDEEAQHENPVHGNYETTQQATSFTQANAAIINVTGVTQANPALDSDIYRFVDGGVGNGATANQGVTFARVASLAVGSNHLPMHMPTAATWDSATVPQTKQEDLWVQAPEMSHPIRNIKNNQNQIKREVKNEEKPAGQPRVHARCASRFSPTSGSEDENMPDVDTRVGGERMVPRMMDFNSNRRHKKKKTARKAVARPAHRLEPDNESAGDYEQCLQAQLIAKRMKRLHGSNRDEDNNSSDENSDGSYYNAIPDDAFSPANPNDEHSTHQLGKNVEPDIEMGDMAGGEENKFVLQDLQIPQENNNGGLQEERTSQDVSYMSSLEDARSIGSLEGPVEPIHRPKFARGRRKLEDDESTDAGQVTPSSDDKSTDESDDNSLSGLKSETEFQGGVDEFPDLRSKENLDTIASQLYPMEKIEHLCSLGLNSETSLPTYKFSVHSKDERIIYDFDVRVDKSNIPNAGRGVFLKFKGARELKPSRIRKKRKRSTRKLPDPLPALRPDGSDVTVMLKGEEFPVPIGSKRMYTESDFVPAPRRTFSSLHPNCGAIELGQYGPFRPEDCISEEKYDIHSFLFSKIPSEWGFDVPEKLDGKSQVINITDELTGDTHEIACRHIPMYVNEVGHDTALKQTVSALDKDDNKVFYYVAIREPMKQGDTIELLVAYEGLYEQVRARKGYAKANIHKNVRGDDHFGSFLQRNFFDREYILEVIDELKPDDIGNMMNWLRVTQLSLSLIVSDFLNQAKQEDDGEKLTNIPLAQQIVALRRFEWIAKHLQPNLKRQRRHCGSSCKLLEGLKWLEWKDLIVALTRLKNIEDANRKNLYAALEREIIDELCYERNGRIITSPMQETFWCGLAMDLTRDLCVATAKELWQTESDKKSLMQTYTKLAKDAVRNVLTGQHTESLAFVPNFNGDCTGVAEDEMRKLNPIRSLAIANEESSGEVLSVLTKSDTITPLEDANKKLAAIPRALTLDSNAGVNSSWYICWQVLRVVDSFARKYLKRSTYSLADLIGQMGIGDETSVIMEDVLTKYAEKRAAKKPKASFSSPGKPKKKRRKKSGSPGGVAVAKAAFFWHVSWKCLKDKCGWRLEHGNRPGDFYAFPPGVTRKGGFKNRVHFFDSVKQIRDQIQADKKLKENALLKNALAEEEKCVALYRKLKGTKSFPSFQSNEKRIDWIYEEVKKQRKD
ncbi:unnamed protein product [Cylindrotheca closterium]|uniref:Uncharacterized protein n=1 Tax=Cylindrotheca closterium TaxID=2856 RepID=A0AAD2PUX4_9STRA|nr:unnamed protein product [Cylindrotheca closterium]